MNTSSITITITAVIATTMMTAFSYGMSYIMRKQFKEPELLNKMLMRLDVIGSSAVEINPLGWVIHYTVGIVFIMCYEIIWTTTPMAPVVENFVLIGGGLGILAIIAWSFVFKIHPHPPKMDRLAYYIQLFIAHIIFGAGAYWATSWLHFAP